MILKYTETFVHVLLKFLDLAWNRNNMTEISSCIY